MTDDKQPSAPFDGASKTTDESEAVVTETKSRGIDLIRAERQRQVLVEGWTPEHDIEHGPDVLLRAAWAYHGAQDASTVQPAEWPWDANWWKPKDRASNVLRAGALAQASFDIGGGKEAEALIAYCAAWLDVHAE